VAEKPIITGFEIIEFDEEPMRDMGTDYNGFNMVYVPGSVYPRKNVVTLMHTSVGITGEMLGAADLARHRRYAEYLIGKNALERERIHPRRPQRQPEHS